MTSLQRRLLSRIQNEGPISFAAFMEAALYDPEEGFYAQHPVGEDGHFVTSPHVSAAFGDLLARQLAESWEALGRPRPYSVVEVGAGDGTLALQILAAVRSVPELADAVRYLAIERTPGARASLRDAGLDVRPSLSDVGPIVGCVLANEVLDNLPFHRLRERDGVVLELMVGIANGRLVEVEAEASPDALDLIERPLGPGEERPVSPAAVAMVRDMAAILQRGYSFVFDYGFGGKVPPGPVHSYRDHQVLADVLEEPGSRDITAAVDLDLVSGEARRAGLQVWGPVSQRDALLGLGYRLWSAGVRKRQADAEATGDWRTATRLFEARSRGSILIDEGKLGGLSVLAFATEGLQPAAALLGDRDAGC